MNVRFEKPTRERLFPNYWAAISLGYLVMGIVLAVLGSHRAAAELSGMAVLTWGISDILEAVRRR